MQTIQSIFAWYFRSIARIMIAIYQPKIVAITGSVGKTTTKDVITALVSGCTSVRSTIRSQNSELTTPLSILGIEVQNKERRILVWLWIILKATLQLFNYKFPHVLVLELGAAAPGDISNQARWIEPDVAVFTALARYPVHLEHYDNKQQLYDEKKSLATYTKANGKVIYPTSDEILSRVLQTFQERSIAMPSYTSSVDQVEYVSAGTRAQVHHLDRWYSILIPGVWSQSIINSYRLGLEVISVLDLDLELAIDNFTRRYVPAPGRSRVLRGIRSSVIIDDSYNASPIAVTSALEMFRQVEAPARKIFIFGDMKELGEHTSDAHTNVGTQVAEFVDLFVVVGSDVTDAIQSARKAGMSDAQTIHFNTAREAGAYLKREIKHRDYILAKASRHAIKLEQALEQIIEPEDKQYLVQEYLNK